MKNSKRFRTTFITMIVAILFIASSSISFAETSVKKINYKGGGKVQVTFTSKTTYKNPKVSVVDNNGKSYKTTITTKKKTYVIFRISAYKTGKTYRVEISGLKKGDANTSFKIISSKTAISTAKKRAKTLGAKKFSGVTSKSTTYRGTAVWKVSLVSGEYKYTYHISQQTGIVLRSEKTTA